MHKSTFIVILFIITIFLVPIAYSYTPPPPPPPPCKQKTMGCYDTGGFKANPGSLARGSFSYYLSETACIGGGCTCSAAGFISSIRQVDADQTSGSCSCIVGASWDSTGKCCGDDTLDCGKIKEGSLCAMDANFRISSWIPVEPNKGDIIYVGCKNTEMLSDGTKWIPCSNTPFRKTVNSHEYFCAGTSMECESTFWKPRTSEMEEGDVFTQTSNCGNTRTAIGTKCVSCDPEEEQQNQSQEQDDFYESLKGSIAECCGSRVCVSRNDGRRLTSGKSVKSNEITYYCASDSIFTFDLDESTQQQTCEGANLIWTGTLCCSEDDDPEEYYNDPNGLGGCWNKQIVYSSDVVPGREDIANLDGNFYGCNIPQDDDVLTLQDSHTNEPLIKENTGYCFQDPRKFYFCSFNNKWEFSSGIDRSNPSTAPASFGVDQAVECCAQDHCWNGETCTINQKYAADSPPVNGFRCIDGEWKEADIKLTPEGESGFCPDKSQCLLNPSSSADIQCLTSDQYVKDNYCENGVWTSRTKFAALQLIDTTQPTDYILSCDTPNYALNNLNYLVQGQLAETIVSEENTNNFCVLLFDDKVRIGTSLNKPITEATSFLKTIGVDNCNIALIDDNKYHACDGTQNSKAWYNQRLNSIIYSNEKFSMAEANLLQAFINFIKNPFDTIKNKIKEKIDESPFDESYINSINKFDKLYLSKQGNKEIRGSVEGLQFKNLVIEYKNFDTDICKFIDEYNKKNQDLGSGIECSKEGGTYYVLAQGSGFTNIDPGVIWSDLTSKLRIS
ncbi:hypothetical protein CMO93_03220 [Candidatus Woesearchaeota archaeon]|nr:hypothetical protein [Candidatus Woesearchaeota archaeon]|tara:strand:+ start:12649 stop:15003 length:2355 start_codon:yes stop_codon:yes gene_type:complete